jgi:hypothetical protein
MSKFMLRRLGVADHPGQYQPNLQACLDAVLEQSGVLMDDVLGGLRAALVPAVGKNTALLTEPAARHAVDLLLQTAPAVRQNFATHLRSSVFGGESSRHAARQLMRFEDFQFLDADQLEANIEFAQSQQAVQVAVDDVMPTLNAMVSNLLGWSSIQAHLNPLKPESFVQALRQTMEEFVPEPVARSGVMGLASGMLGVSLRQLYREVTQWLRAQGVEPVHMAPTANVGLWTPEKAVQSTVARTMLTLDKLRRLLSGELNTNLLSGGRVDFSHTIPASFEALQDMKLVEPMMKRLSDRASKTVAAVPQEAMAGAPVMDLLAEQTEQAQRKKLGVQLGREVVMLMLDNLLQDRRLLPPVHASLQALEPVLVQLAQQDGRFFSERQHPARLFLDRMTHRSLAFAAADAPGYARFQKTFDDAVSEILAGSGEASVFLRVLRGLDEAWEREEALQHKRANEAARSLLHAEQRNLLAQRLSQQFSERLEGLPVPEPVSSFLRGPWAQAVAEAQLKFADGSVDPGGYLGLVDDLIWSVQLRLARRNRARLVQMVPDMLVKMRHGLELISYPQERMAVFFDVLISFHEQVFDSARQEPAGEAAMPSNPALPDAQQSPAAAGASAEEVTAQDYWMLEHEAQDSGFLEDDAIADSVPGGLPPQAFWHLDSLTNGCWVDLALGGGWVRAQLTWASPQRTLFMFVSGNGLAHSMSRRMVERLRAAALIRLVSDGRVLDNALDAVAQIALDNELRKQRR